jgi:hypothetical protein
MKWQNLRDMYNLPVCVNTDRICYLRQMSGYTEIYFEGDPNVALKVKETLEEIQSRA